ncbi:copper homeostasis protein CutC [Roseburia inulinivorans]
MQIRFRHCLSQYKFHRARKGVSLSGLYAFRQKAYNNSALYLGGLTPSLANLICAKEQCTIPVVAMVRPRGRGFCYSLEEYQTMILDTKLFLEHGVGENS